MNETCGGSGAHNKTIVLRGTVKPKQTNADKIRGMTDEELAHFFYNLDSTMIAKDLPPHIAPSKEEWLDWLKQEVGE